MGAQPYLPLFADPWIEARDGDRRRALYRRYYSFKPYEDGRDPALFVGPGQKLVLLTTCTRALFVWCWFLTGTPAFASSQPAAGAAA